MKKLVTLCLATMMILMLAACGGTQTPATTTPEDGSAFGIELTKEGVQAMGEEKVTVEVLKKTAEEYLEGGTMFAYSNDTRTYGDFKAYIGVDANEYQYNEDQNQRTYIWKASDDSTAWFAAIFQEKDGNWVLYASSSANLGLSVNY